MNPRTAVIHVVAGTVGVWMAISPGVVRADMVMSSHGLVDTSCVREVPVGATVNGESGEVSLNGVVIVSVAEAAAASANCRASGVRSDPGGGGANGWSAETTAWAISTGGLSQYDEIQVGMYVPEPPDNPSDQSYQLLWCGLENFPIGGGEWTSVLQPEIRWNPSSGFYITAEAYDDPAYYNFDHMSTPENVSTGDYIVCTVTQTASNAWKIDVKDNTSGAFTFFTFYPGTGSNWGPYSWAQLSVYEASTTACDGLFKSNYAFMTPIVLEQAGPNWNSFNDVLPLVTVEPGYASGCSFSAYWSPWSSGDPYSYLTWSY
jgi:hypothetical protein